MIVTILIFLISLVIYAGYGLAGFAYLLGATLVSYGAGRLIPKHRWILWPAVGANAAVLLLVKLQPVTGWAVLSVFGISYFTLQIISYLADIYRGTLQPERNLFRYAFFVTYLPHLSVGPIERYESMDRALRSRCITWTSIGHGAVRALIGLFKKYVIAARAGAVIAVISADTAAYSGGYALLAMLLYSLQLYADFSGGMDMVLGLSRILGLRLSENFDTPYFSQSFQEFWRRWHITLGDFLRQNVYIPLGGNRKGKVRKVINLIVTFLVSGLWHGVEYLLWGLFNGIFVAFGKKLQTRWKFLNQLGTFLLVTLLWSFFIWPDTVTALTMAGSVFTNFNYGAVAASFLALGLTLTDWIVLAVAAALLWAYDRFREPIMTRFRTMPVAGKTAVICTLGLLVLVFGMYGIGFEAEGFIYSRF